MDQLFQQLMLAARAAWRRRWVGVAAAWAAAILGSVMLTQVPDRYEATARVFVDTKTVLRPLLRDIAGEPEIDQTVSMLARTLITRPNVELLVRRAKLDASITSPTERDALIARLIRDIKLTSLGRDNVYDFSYRDTNPERARTIVQNLVSLFLDSDADSKQRDAEAARNFIDEQIKGYETRLAEAEGRLKEFKLRNLGVADSAGRDYFARMSSLTEELNKLTLELRASEQSRDALKRELTGETATLLPESSAGETGAAPELDARLDAQRKQLDELLRRYTDLHPDVVATRNLITRLEEQRQQIIETRRKAALKAGHLPGTSSDPAYQRVKLSLAEAEASVAALRFRVSDTQGRLNQLRASASRVPQVEAEFAQLNRDYEVIRRNYETLVARREKATISENVDATRPAQFRVIEPPRASKAPVFPSRKVMAMLMLLLSLGVGVAASFVASQLRPTFDSTKALRDITRRPVLGSVSMQLTGSGLRQARIGTFMFGSSVGGLLLLCGALIVWLSLTARVV
jgi:polysaccharide chain length determinant protein (PEP-CTERM system associated)